MDSFDQLRRRFSSTDEDLRRMNTEHRACEARLEILGEKQMLSQEEEYEERTLKKRKLFLKDRMAERLRSIEAGRRP